MGVFKSTIIVLVMFGGNVASASNVYPVSFALKCGQMLFPENDGLDVPGVFGEIEVSGVAKKAKPPGAYPEHLSYELDLSLKSSSLFGTSSTIKTTANCHFADLSADLENTMRCSVNVNDIATVTGFNTVTLSLPIPYERTLAPNELGFQAIDGAELGVRKSRSIKKGQLSGMSYSRLSNELSCIYTK